MTTPDPRKQLSIVEAQLFASTELAVIDAIDASQNFADATERLQLLGMSAAEAEIVLEMPLRTRTIDERDALHAEASRLRAELA